MPRSGSVVTGTEFLFPRRKAPTRAAFDPGLSLLTRESSHDTPVTAKPHRPAAQARMLERGFDPPTEGGGQPKTTKCQETASTDDRRSEWWAPCALTAHWHVAWWLAEMTVEKEIEKMMRLAELTVETGTERDCRLGEATGLVVADGGSATDPCDNIENVDG